MPKQERIAQLILEKARDLKSKNSTFAGCKELSYRKGDIVYHEGEQGERVYLIRDGVVGLFSLSEEGQETLLRVFSKDSIFGHRSFVAQEPYHASAICLAPT